MELEDFNKLIESAKTNRKGLAMLKNAATALQHYETAALLREMETTCFPESDEVKAARKKAEELNMLFRMIDMNPPDGKCWLIAEALKLYNKKKAKFDLMDAAILKSKEAELFFNEKT